MGMAQPQQQLESQSVWRDPAFLAEAISMSALALWLVVSVVSSLNPYVVVLVGLVLYAIFMFSLIKRKGGEDRRFSDLLKAQVEVERSRQWNESNRPLLEQSANQGATRNAKFAMCQAIISAFEESARDQQLSEQERELYKIAIKRIKDMQHTVMQIW